MEVSAPMAEPIGRPCGASRSDVCYRSTNALSSAAERSKACLSDTAVSFTGPPSTRMNVIASQRLLSDLLSEHELDACIPRPCTPTVHVLLSRHPSRLDKRRRVPLAQRPESDDRRQVPGQGARLAFLPVVDRLGGSAEQQRAVRGRDPEPPPL
jgi:hypothetical protein